jgi:hypothetical protein
MLFFQLKSENKSDNTSGFRSSDLDEEKNFSSKVNKRPKTRTRQTPSLDILPPTTGKNINTKRRHSLTYSFFHDKLVKKVSNSGVANRKRFNNLVNAKKSNSSWLKSKSGSSASVSSITPIKTPVFVNTLDHRDNKFNDESKRFQSIRRVVKKQPTKSMEI